MGSGAAHSAGGVAIEESRDPAGEGTDQPRTHCAYCGKALNYQQRRKAARYCEVGHVNKHRRWPSQQAEWDEGQEYLETRDNWEKRAPQMTEPAESQKDWEIQQIMREEIQRRGHR